MSLTSMGADQRMRMMMRQQRVDILEFCYDRVGATFLAAQGACDACENVDVCLDWLGAEKSLCTPEFCPNRPLFEQFKVN